MIKFYLCKLIAITLISASLVQGNYTCDSKCNYWAINHNCSTIGNAKNMQVGSKLMCTCNITGGSTSWLQNDIIVEAGGMCHDDTGPVAPVIPTSPDSCLRNCKDESDSKKLTCASLLVNTKETKITGDFLSCSCINGGNTQGWSSGNFIFESNDKCHAKEGSSFVTFFLVFLFIALIVAGAVVGYFYFYKKKQNPAVSPDLLVAKV